MGSTPSSFGLSVIPLNHIVGSTVRLAGFAAEYTMHDGRRLHVSQRTLIEDVADPGLSCLGGNILPSIRNNFPSPHIYESHKAKGQIENDVYRDLASTQG